MPATTRLLRIIRDPGPAETDGELLRRYADARDEAAFAELVRRNGPVVLRACRSVLGDAAAAEDAFQATFLLLARNAGRLARPGSVAGWLHAAAVRTARDARRAETRRRRREQAHEVPLPVSGDDLSWREVLAVLDAELAALPEAYRVPLVLCYLQELSYEEAARRVGCPVGALRGRLDRGKEKLRRRLARFGLPVAAPVLVLGPPAPVSAALVGATLATVRAAAAGGAVPPAVAGLVGRPTGLRTALATALAAVAGTWAAVGVPSGGPPRAEPPSLPPAPILTAADPPPRADRFGDPLPAGAVARLGSARWRHEGEARSASFSADGKTLAVVSGNDGFVTFFETATGRVLHRLPPPEGTRGPDVVTFSPDGSVFAAQTKDGAVHLWDARAKNPVRTLTADARGAPGGFRSMVFSLDGKFLAAGVGGDRVAVWDVARGTELTALTGHHHANPPVTFAPDGSVIALAASNPVVRLYDARTGKLVRGFDPDQKFAFCVAFSPDGKAIATGGADLIVVSDAATGKELARMRMKQVLDVRFTPDGQSLVAIGEDAKARVWDVSTGKERAVFDSRGWIGRSMALSADGQTIAVGTTYNLVRVWDVATGRELSDPGDGHDAPVHAVAFTPDGRHLVTGGENRRVRVWDAATGREVRRLDGVNAWGLSVSPDGRRLAAAVGWGSSVRVWDLDGTADPLTLPHPGAGIVRCAAFGPADNLLVTAGWTDPGGKIHSKKGPAALRLWDAATGKLVRELPMPEIVPDAVAVSPDGRRVAVGGYSDSPLRLWDLGRGRERRLWEGPGDNVLAVAFTPDGRVLAAGGREQETRLFETETGKEILRLGRHERWVSAAAFSPDGRVLATADGGWIGPAAKGEGPRTVRFWDVATGKELARLEGHGSNATSLAFAPDGTRLACGLHNGSVLVWEAPAKPPAPPARKLGPKELAALWADLAGEAREAYAAVHILAASPDQAVPFLADRLRPARKLDAAKVRQRVADLGDADFAVREAAEAELAGLGEDAEPELRAALTGRPAPEVVRRVEGLLAAVLAAPPPDRRRELRAVWVLELIGTPAARQVLPGLATGDPAARLTREAKASLGRLGGDRKK